MLILPWRVLAAGLARCSGAGNATPPAGDRQQAYPGEVKFLKIHGNFAPRPL